MMPEQKVPSIGRIVHYNVSDGDSADLKHNYSETLPAIIVRVWSDRTVNLKVFTDGPTDVWLTSREIEDEPGQEGRWCWPPYVPPVKSGD